jgi:histidyl-tRNA synthetase
MSLQPVRGTHDLLQDEMQLHRIVSDTACKIASFYGYKEVDTPIFEFTEVFARTLGDASDIVTKEMYTFNDKSHESVTLRPEYTAGIARMFMSNGLLRNIPFKTFSRGPMFRYERPQKGRQRQFHQINVEVLGSEGPVSDIEVISLGAHILDELGLKGDIVLELNTLGDSDSRKVYRDCLVQYFKDHRSKLSKESLLRLEKNPLRILDSKDQSDKTLVQNAPLFTESLNSQSKEFFLELTEGLEALGISFIRNPRLVRGMDYYCHTAFEFTTKSLGAQGAVLAGGRYDGLMAKMGGASVPGIGWAAGIERLAMMIAAPSDLPRPISVVPVNEDAQIVGLQIVDRLRRANFFIDYAYSGTLKKRLAKANKSQAKVAILIERNKVTEGFIILRDMETGEQVESSLTSLEEDLLRYR